MNDRRQLEPDSCLIWLIRSLIQLIGALLFATVTSLTLYYMIIVR